MLSFITERKSCWEMLALEKRPVYIYGMGNGADKIFEVFEQYKIKAKGVFASDEYVRGHSFRGYKVKKYLEVCEEEEDFVVDTEYVWNENDKVSVKIAPEKIKLSLKAQERK